MSNSIFQSLVTTRRNPEIFCWYDFCCSLYTEELRSLNNLLDFRSNEFFRLDSSVNYRALPLSCTMQYHEISLVFVWARILRSLSRYSSCSFCAETFAERLKAKLAASIETSQSANRDLNMSTSSTGSSGSGSGSGSSSGSRGTPQRQPVSPLAATRLAQTERFDLAPVFSLSPLQTMHQPEVPTQIGLLVRFLLCSSWWEQLRRWL